MKHGAVTLVGEMALYRNDDSYYYVTTELGRALPDVIKQHRCLALLASFCPWHCSVAVKTASK